MSRLEGTQNKKEEEKQPLNQVLKIVSPRSDRKRTLMLLPLSWFKTAVKK